jgi:hypothetical protein
VGNDDKHHVLERKPSNNNIEIGDSEITTKFLFPIFMISDAKLGEVLVDLGAII